MSDTFESRTNSVNLTIKRLFTKLDNARANEELEEMLGNTELRFMVNSRPEIFAAILLELMPQFSLDELGEKKFWLGVAHHLGGNGAEKLKEVSMFISRVA